MVDGCAHGGARLPIKDVGVLLDMHMKVLTCKYEVDLTCKYGGGGLLGSA